jgi:hypothetical protein
VLLARSVEDQEDRLVHSTTDFADPAAAPVAVAMLRWPQEEEQRRRLAAAGTPRLLFVGPDDQAPPAGDELEDWMRDPPSPADLVARLAALEQRAQLTRQQPRLDADGLLWSDRRWVVIPDTQLCVVELLLANADRLVTTAAITTVYVRHGSSGHPASVRTMLNRLVGRFAQVGLRLHLVRGKGAILELPRR